MKLQVPQVGRLPGGGLGVAPRLTGRNPPHSGVGMMIPIPTLHPCLQPHQDPEEVQEKSLDLMAKSELPPLDIAIFALVMLMRTRKLTNLKSWLVVLNVADQVINYSQCGKMTNLLSLCH